MSFFNRITFYVSCHAEFR